MSSPKIVYVVGAGASAEFKLPVGKELIKKIADGVHFKFDRVGNLIGGDLDLYLSVKQYLDSEKYQLRSATYNIDFGHFSSALSLAPSIDNYLNTHKDNIVRVALGKVSIFKKLREAEGSSSLFFEPDNIYSHFPFERTNETWLQALFSTMVVAGNLASFIEQLSRVTFVCFNYDRVIERFFFLGVLLYFDLTEEQASNFIAENLDIYHPYGVVGELKNQKIGSGYGEIPSQYELSGSFKNIVTFTEGGNAARRKIVRQKIADCDDLVFLGFSFLDLNMEYLAGPEKSRFSRILATNFGMSSDNSQVVESFIRSRMVDSLDADEVEFFPGKSFKLIQNYSSYLTRKT